MDPHIALICTQINPFTISYGEIFDMVKESTEMTRRMRDSTFSRYYQYINAKVEDHFMQIPSYRRAVFAHLEKGIDADDDIPRRYHIKY
eukprot:247522-Prorocentrum_lima.AAC.1